jgi:hypothetical protein
MGHIGLQDHKRNILYSCYFIGLCLLCFKEKTQTESAQGKYLGNI